MTEDEDNIIHENTDKEGEGFLDYLKYTGLI